MLRCCYFEIQIDRFTWFKYQYSYIY